MQTLEEALRRRATEGRFQDVETAEGRPAIAVRDLTKQLGLTRAVDRLSVTVTAGKVTGFLGPNGAGKTTTIRTILGLARPDSGEASVFGMPTFSWTTLCRASVR